ncbi:MAG: ATP-binding protein [Actinobacteria bacterium]|nr:ATP-binding protein [Actinomycetota bacterium]
MSAAFAPNPDSARAARRFVADALARWHRDDVSETACLLTSELVTNAILHAHSPIELVVEVDDDRHLTVEVLDDDASAVVAYRASPEDVRGRGLGLVESLSDAWGVRPRRPGGKAVWFALA